MGKNPSNNEKKEIFSLKSIFPQAHEVFSINLESLDKLKDSCLFVLDTNALLVPYKIKQESLDQIEQTFRCLIDANRLIIPGRVAREFAIHRPKQICEIFHHLSQRKKTQKLKIGTYPLLESLENYDKLKSIQKEINQNISEYRKTISLLLSQIQGWTWNDPVSLIYNQIFSKEVIEDPEFDPKKIEEDLKRRIQHRIPPGYKDSSKPDKGVGDLLIWYTILEIGKREKKNVVFVSGDVKADWWHQSDNNPIYPRYELVEEFRNHSGGFNFHIVQFSEFLDLVGVPGKVIDEVRRAEITVSGIAVSDLAIMKTVEGMKAEESVYRWYNKKISDARSIISDIPPFSFIIEHSDGYIEGVIVKYLNATITASLNLQDVIEKIFLNFISLDTSIANRYTLIFTTSSEEDIKRVHFLFKSLKSEKTQKEEYAEWLRWPSISPRFSFIFGVRDEDSNFYPHFDDSYD
ncbi:hypothetical protein CEE45_01540 [Candidatus Heimdallarchaeota archaeon B3_Heim]|nr:MAG: hypothetical protein CEE45_01540 [Candidatus Heimdallarchaeota archaeon B3_Heim]